MNNQPEQAKNMLIWNKTYDYGYFPCDVWLEHNSLPSPYDQAYIDKYLGYEETTMGGAINKVRLSLVERYTTGMLVDIGIGSGSFVKYRNYHYPSTTFGYDITGIDKVEELIGANRYVCPLRTEVLDATFWDSLEHMKDPAQVLCRVHRYAFFTIPVFTSLEQARESKHFWPEEHYYYWTRESFETYLGRHGFVVLEINDAECNLGREEVLSFACKRK